MTKKTKLRTMIPWSILIILYFIWANQNEFNISKNVLGVLLTPMTGILWFSVVATFTDAILEEQNDDH
jgi:hypothetical protein